MSTWAAVLTIAGLTLITVLTRGFFLLLGREPRPLDRREIRVEPVPFGME